MFKDRKLIVLFHILIWCIFLLFPVLVLPKPASFLENDQLQLVIYFSIGCLTIGFYYFNYHFIIPRFLFKREYFHFFGLFFGFILLSILSTKFIITSLYFEHGLISSSKPKLLVNFLGRFLVVFAIAFGVRLFQKMKQIETEKLNAELISLKAQINPHFLFNTLNGIYGLALTNSNKTADSISKLASMMRYVLTETTAEKVPLINEIKYISDYIAFQKLRLTKKTKVNFTIEGTFLDQEISPILFISFIENAFKYGVSNEVESTIKIHIVTENNAISLTVKNDQLNTNTNNNEESCGIGLKNTKRRLDLIYENKYSLEITNTDKEHQIILKIQLK